MKMPYCSYFTNVETLLKPKVIRPSTHWSWCKGHAAISPPHCREDVGKMAAMASRGQSEHCNQMPLSEKFERNRINLVSMVRVYARRKRLEVTVYYPPRGKGEAQYGWVWPLASCMRSWWWTLWTQNPIIHPGGFHSLASPCMSPSKLKLGLQSLPSVPMPQSVEVMRVGAEENWTWGRGDGRGQKGRWKTIPPGVSWFIMSASKLSKVFPRTLQ